MVRLMVIALFLVCLDLAQSSSDIPYHACRNVSHASNAKLCHSLMQRSLQNRSWRPDREIVTDTDSYILRAIDFGADPTGQRDASPALQSMISTAWNSSRGFKIDVNSGMPDFGGLVMDLTGGHYRLDTPLQFPSSGGGNGVFANGALHASPAFPRDSYLLQLTGIPVSGGHWGRYRYWTFRNLELDANGTAAGYTKTGLLSYGTVNELFVTHCWFRELNDYNNCHNDALKQGTGLTLYNNDHSLDNIVIFCTQHGVVTNSSAVIYRNMHIYTEGSTLNASSCFWLQASVRMTRIDMSYMDGCAILIDNPGQVQLNNNFFLLGAGMQAAGGLIVLRSTTTDNFKIAGFQMKNNVISGGLKGPTSVIKLDESQHSFDSAPLDTVVDDNLPRVLPFLALQATRKRWTQTFSSTSRLSIDVQAELLFPLTPLTHVLYSLSLRDAEDCFVLHALLPIAVGDTNVTVVTSSVVSQATLSLYVDQSLYT